MTASSASPDSPAPPTPSSAAARAHDALLPYTVGLLAASALLQLVIALAGSRITVLTTLPLVLIAIGAAVHLGTRGRALGRVRYGRFVAHALLYAIVVVGYLLHLLVLTLLDAPVGEGWFGPALAMPALWGLGLVVHGVGAVLDRGFEAARP